MLGQKASLWVAAIVLAYALASALPRFAATSRHSVTIFVQVLSVAGAAESSGTDLHGKSTRGESST